MTNRIRTGNIRKLAATIVASLVVVYCVVYCVQARAVDDSPLAGVPSKPGAHVERIKALGENEWLELGPPAADEKWGKARGRSWCGKLTFAPELRGAFYYGEGVHGFAKPDGRYMDDLWFYDIPGHRWVCCYPGTPTKDLKLSLNADGFEVDDAGRLVPVAQQVHAYEMSTYDPHSKRLFMMPNEHEYWHKPLAPRKDWYKRPPADASPWSYSPASDKWERMRTGTPGPRSGYGDTLIYVPTRKTLFFAHGTGEVWFFDIAGKKWKQSKPEGPEPPFGIDGVSCYDAKRDRIYIGGGGYPVAPADTHAFWVYDLKTDRWVDPQPKGKPCRGANSFGTNNASLHYDAAGDKVLLVRHSNHYEDNADRVGVYVYDPTTNAWTEEPLKLPEKLMKYRGTKSTFLDPELGVMFLVAGGDSDDDTVMWAWRYPAKK